MALRDTGRQAALLARLAPHPPRPPQEVTSRAGRNLPAAIVTAIALLAVVGLSLAFYIELFAILAVVFVVAGLWEAAGALLARGIKISLIPLVVGAIVMAIETWINGVTNGMLAFIIVAGIAMLWRSFVGGDDSLRDACAGVFVLGWVGLFGMFAIAIVGLPQGAQAVIAMVMLPVANDTGGWCAGIVFGKHPIAPSISPKKSWEGFAGSVLASLLVSYLTVGLLLDLDWYWVIAVGILTPVFATAGDFAESLLKRDLGVKDMGSVFPGHGGILDRVDSLLFCAPMLYLAFGLGMGVF